MDCRSLANCNGRCRKLEPQALLLAIWIIINSTCIFNSFSGRWFCSMRMPCSDGTGIWLTCTILNFSRPLGKGGANDATCGFVSLRGLHELLIRLMSSHGSIHYSSLRPLTRGKRFLLFLHSAYYDCTWAEPAPLTGSFKDWSGNGGWGGGWVVGSPTRACNTGSGIVWDFSALGRPTSSVSRRVVKLTVSHYYSAPVPLQKRGYEDEIRKPVVFMIPSTGTLVGVAYTMAAIFGTRKER